MPHDKQSFTADLVCTVGVPCMEEVISHDVEVFWKFVCDKSDFPEGLSNVVQGALDDSASLDLHLIGYSNLNLTDNIIRECDYARI